MKNPHMNRTFLLNSLSRLPKKGVSELTSSEVCKVLRIKELDCSPLKEFLSRECRITHTNQLTPTQWMMAVASTMDIY